MAKSPLALPRAPLVALAFVGCNMVCGLDEPTLRAAGGAGGGGAPSQGGGGSAAGGAMTGGGGAAQGGAPVGGSGGEGGSAGGCPEEEPPLQGTELLVSPSFEQMSLGWTTTAGFPALTFDSDSLCGCVAAALTLPGTYGEVRSSLSGAIPAGSTLRLRARMRAPDSVVADIVLRGDNNNIEPPFSFQADAADGTVDGWRLAQGTTVTTPALGEAYLAVELNGSADVVIGLDCMSATWE